MRTIKNKCIFPSKSLTYFIIKKSQKNLRNQKHGSYQFETSDPKGNKHGFNGVIHEFVPNQKITRTFEMENTPFGVQLEFLVFEALTADSSKLCMQIVYKSVALRDQMLQLPFAQGINTAHNGLQDILNKQKQPTMTKRNKIIYWPSIVARPDDGILVFPACG